MQSALKAKAIRMVYGQAALAKLEKISDVITEHSLIIAATCGNLYSRWTTVITTSRRSMITPDFFCYWFWPMD